MALSLAQVQAKITALNTQYDQLAGTNIGSYQTQQQMVQRAANLKQLRDEIEYWEQREAELSAQSGSTPDSGDGTVLGYFRPTY